MSRHSLIVMVALASTACGPDEVDPAKRIGTQSWSETVETVDGLPIGKKQIEWEEQTSELSSEGALDELRVRKKIVARAIEAPPEYATLALRQAWTEAYILEEIDGEKAEGQGEDEETLAELRTAIEKELSEPHGWAATLVTVIPEDETDSERALEHARKMVTSLGPDPTDDAVVVLDEEAPEGLAVHVNYGVRFAASGEDQMRPGWVEVFPQARKAIEELPMDDRTTDAFEIDGGAAQFLVKLLKLPGKDATPEEVSAEVDQRLEDLYRETEVVKLVEQLVEDGDWSVNPSAMESDLEEE